MQKFILPPKSRYPVAPPYRPLLTVSSSSMISIALILGAPLNVPAGRNDPAGNTASTASKLSLSSLISPRTVDPICITCEYLWIFMNWSTLTVPISLILPISLRARSTNITCSALSFSSARSSSSKAISCSFVAPLFLVPAIGHVYTLLSDCFTIISGELPIISKSPKLK